jgi:hypothetical protein
VRRFSLKESDKRETALFLSKEIIAIWNGFNIIQSIRIIRVFKVFA